MLGLFAGSIASSGQGSVGLATDATHVTLEVDSVGDALVAWTQGGAKESALVTPQGKLVHGGSLSGPDVSKPAHVPGLPATFAVRSTAGGNLWALQLLATSASRQVTLDLSHWKGEPTKLTMTSDGTRLTGSATFDGKPVTGLNSSLSGLRPKIYVYIDCFGCGGKADWTPMLGVAPKADGTFAVLLRSSWKGSKYRATVVGPNEGTSYAPDAQTIISG